MQLRRTSSILYCSIWVKFTDIFIYLAVGLDLSSDATTAWTTELLLGKSQLSRLSVTDAEFVQSETSNNVYFYMENKNCSL